MTLAPILLFSVLIICMIIGVPISWALCLSSFSAFLAMGNMPVALLAQRVFTGTDTFSLLAVPAFILAGEIMSFGGISKRLIDLANVFVGRIRGSLGLVSIVASTFFAALSGSATATTAAIGGLMFPEMAKRKYPEDFSAAIQAIGGTLGPVIPPSILIIFYGIGTGVSISKLLIAGLIPGIIACICLCILCYFIAVKQQMPISEIKPTFKDALISLKSAFWALMMPIIILGGIYAGIFTPTESAGVAVVYGIIVSMFIYRELKLKDLMQIFKKSALVTANLIILVASAQLFGWLVSYYNMPKIIALGISSISSSPIVFLLLVNVILIIAGMFMEAIAIIVIMAPILHPLAVSYGFDPIHFGFISVFILSLGIATPPFGPCLFVACGISKRPFIGVAKQLMPFIILMMALGLLYSFVPVISTWLPKIMK